MPETQHLEPIVALCACAWYCLTVQEMATSRGNLRQQAAPSASTTRRRRGTTTQADVGQLLRNGSIDPAVLASLTVPGSMGNTLEQLLQARIDILMINYTISIACTGCLSLGADNEYLV